MGRDLVERARRGDHDAFAALAAAAMPRLDAHSSEAAELNPVFSPDGATVLVERQRVGPRWD